MTRSNMHFTLTNGKKIKCVADGSSAPEMGYIVESLILPLLGFHDAEKELRLIREHCTMGEQRINAIYRYVINLQTASVSFFEENYNECRGRFHLGANITQRYDDYLVMTKV